VRIIVNLAQRLSISRSQTVECAQSCRLRRRSVLGFSDADCFVGENWVLTGGFPWPKESVALDAQNAITGSFDVVIARTEHRTNEIMKVLALASILLLPGALIAGVMGMNMNFSANVFAGSVLFWVVVAVVLLLAGATLAAARVKHWI